MGNKGVGNGEWGMGNEVEKLISNTQCPILRLTSALLGTSRSVQVLNAQFQIPEKSYTIMSYAGGQVGIKAEASLFIDDN
ncbi:hypothetical protein NSTC731_00779 [Nostoc sp. DSM 114167]|jgi:hypothetical protein